MYATPTSPNTPRSHVHRTTTTTTTLWLCATTLLLGYGSLLLSPSTRPSLPSLHAVDEYFQNEFGQAMTDEDMARELQHHPERFGGQVGQYPIPPVQGGGGAGGRGGHAPPQAHGFHPYAPPQPMGAMGRGGFGGAAGGGGFGAGLGRGRGRGYVPEPQPQVYEPPPQPYVHEPVPAPQHEGPWDTELTFEQRQAILQRVWEEKTFGNFPNKGALEIFLRKQFANASKEQMQQLAENVMDSDDDSEEDSDEDEEDSEEGSGEESEGESTEASEAATPMEDTSSDAQVAAALAESFSDAPEKKDHPEESAQGADATMSDADAAFDDMELTEAAAQSLVSASIVALPALNFDAAALGVEVFSGFVPETLSARRAQLVSAIPVPPELRYVPENIQPFDPSQNYAVSASKEKSAVQEGEISSHTSRSAAALEEALREASLTPAQDRYVMHVARARHREDRGRTKGKRYPDFLKESEQEAKRVLAAERVLREQYNYQVQLQQPQEEAQKKDEGEKEKPNPPAASSSEPSANERVLGEYGVAVLAALRRVPVVLDGENYLRLHRVPLLHQASSRDPMGAYGDWVLRTAQAVPQVLSAVRYLRRHALVLSRDLHGEDWSGAYGRAAVDTAFHAPAIVAALSLLHAQEDRSAIPAVPSDAAELVSGVFAEAVLELAKNQGTVQHILTYMRERHFFLVKPTSGGKFAVPVESDAHKEAQKKKIEQEKSVPSGDPDAEKKKKQEAAATEDGGSQKEGETTPLEQLSFTEVLRRLRVAMEDHFGYYDNSKAENPEGYRWEQKGSQQWSYERREAIAKARMRLRKLFGLVTDDPLQISTLAGTGEAILGIAGCLLPPEGTPELRAIDEMPEEIDNAPYPTHGHKYVAGGEEEESSSSSSSSSGEHEHKKESAPSSHPHQPFAVYKQEGQKQEEEGTETNPDPDSDTPMDEDEEIRATMRMLSGGMHAAPAVSSSMAGSSSSSFARPHPKRSHQISSSSRAHGAMDYEKLLRGHGLDGEEDDDEEEDLYGGHGDHDDIEHWLRMQQSMGPRRGKGAMASSSAGFASAPGKRDESSSSSRKRDRMDRGGGMFGGMAGGGGMDFQTLLGMLGGGAGGMMMGGAGGAGGFASHHPHAGGHGMDAEERMMRRMGGGGGRHPRSMAGLGGMSAGGHSHHGMEGEDEDAMLRLAQQRSLNEQQQEGAAAAESPAASSDNKKRFSDPELARLAAHPPHSIKEEDYQIDLYGTFVVEAAYLLGTKGVDVGGGQIYGDYGRNVMESAAERLSPPELAELKRKAQAAVRLEWYQRRNEAPSGGMMGGMMGGHPYGGAGMDPYGGMNILGGHVPHPAMGHHHGGRHHGTQGDAVMENMTPEDIEKMFEVQEQREAQQKQEAESLRASVEHLKSSVEGEDEGETPQLKQE